MPLFSRKVTAASATVIPAVPLAPFITPDLGDDYVTREAVWKIPSFAQGLQILAGTIASFPLKRLRGHIVDLDWQLGQQLDPAEATSATLARLVEDLVLYPAAYLVVLGRYADGYPSGLRYVAAETVTEPQTPGGPYRIGQQLIPNADVVRFPSFWPGLIAVGGRTIRTSLALENAVYRNATTDLPSGILYDSGPDIPGEKVSELLSAWEAGRKRRTTGFLSSRFRFERQSWNSEELALVPSREHQISEAARLLNIPTRYLNAPTNSSLTYATVEGQRRDLVDTSLRPYITVIEDRLSLGDITPRGQQVRFSLDDFLRSDLKARYDAYAVGLAAGFVTLDEVRATEHLQPLGS